MNDSNAPSPVIRSQNAEMFVEDTGAGWAEMRVVIGEHDSGFYAFSLVFDPLEDIRQFERNLAPGEDARMLLRAEPGAVEVVATPVNPEGWVRLRLWLIDHRNARTLDFDALCPASSLVASMRTNIGFLAREYKQVKFEGTRVRDLGRKLFGWFAKRTS